MAEVWAKTLESLKKDPSYRNMFHMMEQYSSVVAAEMTDKSDKEIKRTYGEYVYQSKTACGNLQRMGYDDTGAIIGLIYDTCMDWPVLLWGILMSGNIPLLMNPGSEPHLLCNIMKEAVAAAYVAAKPVEGCDARFIDAEEVLAAGAQGTEKWGEYVALCTSGTTGNSRIFLYDSRTIANHIISFDEARQINPDMPFIENKPCKLLAFLPFHHVFGFSVVYILYSITGKTLVYLRDRSVQSILGACQNHGVTHLYCIPLFFNALASGIEKKLEGKDVTKLSWPVQYILKRKTLGTKIRSMITGGGHIPERTLEVINSVGYPLCNGFGMTETGIIAVERSLDPKQRIRGSLGIPFTLTEWKIEPEGASQGELLIRGDALYSASMIDGKIVPRDKSAWFATGDVVCRKPDGLYIAGRIKDVIINASGENIYPEEMEDNFADMPGVKNFCITGVKNGAYEDVVIVVEPKQTDFEKTAVIEAVRRVNEKLSAGEKVSRIFISADPLPVSGNMKVKRQTIKHGIEDGSWSSECLEVYAAKTAPAPEVSEAGTAPVPGASAASAPTDHDDGSQPSASLSPEALTEEKAEFESGEEFKEILETVRQLTSENLGVDIDRIGDRDHFIMNLGGDSLTVYSIFTAVSEKYGIEMMDEEMLQLENVYVAAKFTYIKLHEKDGAAASGK